jgi:polyphosphate kinase
VSQSGKSRRRDPDLFFNREISWLRFNARVLEEAKDASNPLLERLKFAAIFASNLDEFFMVRVAATQHELDEGGSGPDLAGLTPAQQLGQISLEVHQLVQTLYATLSTEILPALAVRGLRILSLAELEAPQRASLSRYFRDEVLPALTPLAIDSSRPFPLLANLSLDLALLLAPAEEGGPPRLAVVQVPAMLPRLVRVPGGEATSFVCLEEIIRSELPVLFPGQTIVDSTVFRIARDAEIELDDEGGRDFLRAVEEELQARRRSRVVRLEVESSVGEDLLGILVDSLQVQKDDVYRIPGALDIRAFMRLVQLPLLEDLRDPPLRPLPLAELAEREDLFEVLKERDILVHHPYDSFEPVANFISRAAEDPDVLAIKQTLYRTTGDSPVVQALARGAEQGKQVTVVVELLARFDEQTNIQWARQLEKAGAHVIYGIRGYKTHAKICLVVRRGRRGIERYVHLGTGNYNEQTARVYTDFGLMTSDRAIGEDASAFFNALTGYSDPPRMKKLVMAPTGLRERLLYLIGREKRRAEAGQAAEIRGKMNSLADEELIRALYEASAAGVRIRLNVRGICCLRPGVKGVSQGIEVVSIVDRFLEHARIFYFRNGGDEEVYLSSADWMPRNLDRRIELLFPVEAPECRQKVMEALDAMFQDNVKSRWLQTDGTYKKRRVGRGEEPFRAQIHIYRTAQAALEKLRAVSGATLEPLTAPEQKP